ncbi:MAG: heme A synthase [Cyanophyceae cyanobacterium]
MADSSLDAIHYSTQTGIALSGATASEDSDQKDLAAIAQSRLRWVAFKLAIATWLLMAIGSATRVTNAGLACPDWPLCYGQLLPWQQMNLQVFLEWFHRLDAGLLVLGTTGMVGYAVTQRQRLPRWVLPLVIVSWFTLLSQAVLGALTVTQLLRFDIVTAHLGTALAFFVMMLVLGTGLLPQKGLGQPWSLRALTIAAAITIYGQSLAGALVGSQWALHQCLNLQQLCGFMHGHLWGIIPAVGFTLGTIVVAWKTPALNSQCRNLINGAAILLGIQLLVGYGTFRLHLQVEPLTVLHQAIAAALLGVLVSFAVLVCRDRTISA